MQGFLRLRGSPARVRLVTRMIAVVPALIALTLAGDRSTVVLLVATQVVLSLQLPFALVPLIRFTADRALMGRHANPRPVTAIAWAAAAAVTGCNAWLVARLLPPAGGLAQAALGLLALAGLALLAWLALVPLRTADGRA
jgi:manganese transport protein